MKLFVGYEADGSTSRVLPCGMLVSVVEFTDVTQFSIETLLLLFYQF